MKKSFKAKAVSRPAPSHVMTLGDLVASTYQACGEKKAPKLLRLALASRLVRFSRTPCVGC